MLSIKVWTMSAFPVKGTFFFLKNKSIPFCFLYAIHFTDLCQTVLEEPGVQKVFCVDCMCGPLSSEGHGGPLMFSLKTSAGERELKMAV